MAYEDTDVTVSKSQQQIRNLVYAHHGMGLSLISMPPREGFEAYIEIEAKPYHVRIMATCKKVKDYDNAGRNRNRSVMESLTEKENRRVWRVLYYHLKALFEAADSGVIDIRDIILPYVVLPDGMTVSEHISKKMPELLVTTNPIGLLTA